MKGLVTKSTGSWYEIQTEHAPVNARLRGNFRIKDIKLSNPIAVGDEVRLAIIDGDYMIEEILPRKNYIIRKSPKHKHLDHILAANLDAMLLVVTMEQPRTSLGYIDRMIVAAESFGIPVILNFNKVDIYSPKSMGLLQEYRAIYQNLAQVVITSIGDASSIKELENLLKNKTVLICGHSGVGKSSIVNAIDESLDLKVGEISRVHEKGMHTTTFAQLFYIEKLACRLIDTPGIKEFGLTDFSKLELRDYFREFAVYQQNCKFSNCIHQNEPDCGVIAAFLRGDISESRMMNYAQILSSLSN
ncbi:MAG: ribosome small subunit-dependent GTPase A [Chitinophagales bacterium]|jgi:ribosome biogenesis GTPase|nr:ribosome small subunit-dependent GTPase A [Chitinophagales bacterium]